jgi:FdhE protein
VSVPAGPASQAGRWDERIARARSLAADSSTASSILAFYADLAEFQQHSARNCPPLADLRDAAEIAAASLAGFLEWLHGHAPAPLAGAAAESRAWPREGWKTLLAQRVEQGHSDEDPPTAFIVEAVLQPFVVRAAETAAVGLKTEVGLKADTTNIARCPVCGSLPVVAALREEGQGARRSLLCALCFHEWDYLRIQCPSCEESRFDALPVYTADASANARIDACDSCRTYIKTIDLSRDGLAVPTVDDLASLPLDLWARDRGYRRLYPNLLRL